MRSLAELKAANNRVAARELAELRGDTVKGLRHAYTFNGIEGVKQILAEAGVLTPLFNRFTDRHDYPRPGEDTVLPNDRA